MMSRHSDFERIFIEFRDYYKDSVRGEREYYDWLNALRLDEKKPYAQARESFRWAANMLRPLKEDADSKYYGIIVGLPIMSMNGNIYKERDLIAAALSLKGKSPSVNHKDEYWLSPKNPRNRWGTVTVVDAKYEDGAVEAILKVPKDATCPVCPRPNSKLTDLIDERHIVNVSLEGTMQGAFEFTDPPFTLLTCDVLPGIPLARIKPLEKIMVEALNFNKQESKEEKTLEAKTRITAKIMEDNWQNATNAKVNVNTTSGQDPNFRGNPVGPTLNDAIIDRQDDVAKTEMGTPAVSDNYAMKGGYLNRNVAHHTTENKACSCPKGEHMEDGECVPDKREAAPAYQGDEYTANMSGPPVYAGVTDVGAGRTKAPERSMPDVGGLPGQVGIVDVRGKAPAGGATPTVVKGDSPFESLPSLEERKAKVMAELKAAGAEEKALRFEEEYGKVYSQLQQRIGEASALKNSNMELEKRRDEAVRELANKEVERDGWRKKYEHQLGIATELNTQLESYKNMIGNLTEKYNKSLSVNLELSQKVTKANEDYLDVAKKLESTEEALGRARNEAKRIAKITV